MIIQMRSWCTQKTQYALSEIKEIAKAELEVIKTKPIRSMLLLAGVISCIVIDLLPLIGFAALTSSSLVIYLSIEAITSFLSGVCLATHMLDIIQVKDSVYKKAHSVEKLQNKDITLVLEAEYDHNSAFSKAVPKPLESKYPLAFRKISNLKQFSKAINDSASQNNKIKILWIRAHGSPISMTLGKVAAKENLLWNKKEISIFNFHKLKKSFMKLDPEAVIVLESCATAKPIKNNWENIAQKIARMAQGRKVICAKETFNECNVKTVQPLKIEMLKLPSMNGSLFQRIKGIGHVFLEVGTRIVSLGQRTTMQNVTVVYQFDKHSPPEPVIKDIPAYLEDLIQSC